MIDPSIHVHGLEYVEHLSYVGLFLAVAFCGYLIPIPEEIILILGGYLAAEGFSNIFLVILFCFLGAVFGDTLIYYLSGHGSRFTQKYHNKVESTHAGWYMRQMRKNPSQTIFLSRFIVGFRFLNPLVSGLMNIPWSIFVVSIAFSALFYIPLVVAIGYFFNAQINTVLHIAEYVRHDIIQLLIVGSVLLVVLFFKNLVEKKR